MRHSEYDANFIVAKRSSLYEDSNILIYRHMETGMHYPYIVCELKEDGVLCIEDDAVISFGLMVGLCNALYGKGNYAIFKENASVRGAFLVAERVLYAEM